MQLYAGLWVIIFCAIGTYILLKLVGLLIPLRMSDVDMETGDLAVHGHEVYPSDVPSLGYAGHSAIVPIPRHPPPSRRPGRRRGADDHRLVRRDRKRHRRARPRPTSGRGGRVARTRVRPARDRVGPPREAQAQADTSALLEAGATWLGEPDVPRHIVVSGSTPEGLRDLAEREHADLIVFGSEYRTSPGSVQPGTSALRLLEGGPIAVALAPAGFSDRSVLSVETVATVVGDDGDPAPRETAESLAAALGATIIARGEGEIGVAVVGSKPGTAAGRVTLSAAAQYLIEMIRCPVLVLPHGVALRFGSPGATTTA